MSRPCLSFRPDHNGECLNCDEWEDGHYSYCYPGLLAAWAVCQPVDPRLVQTLGYFRPLIDRMPDSYVRVVAVRALVQIVLASMRCFRGVNVLPPPE